MNNILHYFDYFKPKDNTAIHPKYKTLIQKVIKIKGRQLYQFKNLADMPHNRFTKATRFQTEFEMRIDADIVKTYNKKVKGLFLQILESEDLKKTRTSAHRGLMLNETLDMNLDMLLSLDASYRLVSCAWFWEDENLDDYDFEIGDNKISLFKEEKLESFFLSKPMRDFLPQMNISAQDLRAFSQYEKELKKLLFKQLKNENDKNEKTIS